MNPINRGEIEDLEHPDQLECTAKFLEDLATRVGSAEKRQLCLREAKHYHLAAQLCNEQTERLKCANNTAA
jgi:hypothetical protein